MTLARHGADKSQAETHDEDEDEDEDEGQAADDAGGQQGMPQRSKAMSVPWRANMADGVKTRKKARKGGLCGSFQLPSTTTP